MKWYFSVLVLYSSFWGFLGWGIQGEITGLIITLALYLTSMLITIFNFKNPVLKEALIILYVPSMIVYAIIKNYGSMSKLESHIYHNRDTPASRSSNSILLL